MSTLCDCTQRTCSSGEATSYMLATHHHPSCPRGWPSEALTLIAALGQSADAVAGRRWVTECPESAWKGYCEVKDEIVRRHQRGAKG